MEDWQLLLTTSILSWLFLLCFYVCETGTKRRRPRHIQNIGRPAALTLASPMMLPSRPKRGAVIAPLICRFARLSLTCRVVFPDTQPSPISIHNFKKKNLGPVSKRKTGNEIILIQALIIDANLCSLSLTEV
jgi:hypothetical protein